MREVLPLVCCNSFDVLAPGERYAESSAVPAWLLGEEVGRPVREVLRRAELVMRSDPTLVECDRVLIRAVTLGEIDEATAADCRAYLNTAGAPTRADMS